MSSMTSCLCNWEDTWPFGQSYISEGKEEEGVAHSFCKPPGMERMPERDDNLPALRVLTLRLFLDLILGHLHAQKQSVTQSSSVVVLRSLCNILHLHEPLSTDFQGQKLVLIPECRIMPHRESVATTIVYSPFPHFMKHVQWH